MNKIILFEGKIDFSLIDSKVFDNNPLIVSFDSQSHKSLNEKKIKHKLIEEYFSEEDVVEVDLLALRIGMNWYKDLEIEKYLKYEELNLGSLLELELPSYFLKILKRIIGIKKIIEIEQPKKIISYSLQKYVENICKAKNIEIENISNVLSDSLFFDNISIPINVGFVNKKITISRERYYKIKNMVEKLFDLISRNKIVLNKIRNTNSILLLDFDTKLYKNFLESFPETNTNIIIFNQRKPAIRDLESLKIIKKSNCKILLINDFESKELKNKIRIKQNNHSSGIKSLLNEEKILKNIFQHEKQSFWPIIKNDFSRIIMERINESIQRLILLDGVFNYLDVKLIVDWAHTGVEEKEVAYIAKKRKIPIFSLQHGIMTLNSKFEKYHPIMPVLPTDNAKMLVWGEIMKSYLMEHNIDQNKILMVGSPRHDRFFKNKQLTDNNTILIASNLFFHVNFDGIDTRAVERFELYLEKILKHIIKKSNKKPIIKLHATEYFDVTSIVKKIDSSIPIYQHEDILELLESCDVLISMNYSTILLDGLILNKPTMVILPEKQNFEEEEVIKNNAVLAVSNTNEMENKLDELLFDNKVRQELVSNGKKFIDRYFSLQGNSSKYLADFLIDF